MFTTDFGWTMALTNDFENLTRLKNEPYHKVITAAAVAQTLLHLRSRPVC